MEGHAYCPVCGIGFKGEHDRDLHLQLKHSGTRIICSGCGNSYAGLRGYEQHRRRAKSICRENTFSLLELPDPGIKGEVKHVHKALPRYREEPPKEARLRPARAPSDIQPEPHERSQDVRGVTPKPEDPAERAHSRTKVMPPPSRTPTASHRPRHRSPAAARPTPPAPKSEVDEHMEWLHQHLRHVKLVVGGTLRPVGQEPTVSVEIAMDMQRPIPAKPPIPVPERLPVEGLPFKLRPGERMPPLIREPPTSTIVRPRDQASSPVQKTAAVAPRASPAKSRKTVKPVTPVIPSMRFQPPLEETIAAAIVEVPALALVSDEGASSLEEDLHLSEDDDIQMDQDMTIDDD